MGGARGDPGHHDSLGIRARRIGRAPRGILDIAPTLEPARVEIHGVAIDFVDVARFDRADDVDALADVGAAREGCVPVLAVAVEVVHARAGAELDALELAVEDEVRHTAQRIRAVGRRGAACLRRGAPPQSSDYRTRGSSHETTACRDHTSGMVSLGSGRRGRVLAARRRRRREGSERGRATAGTRGDHGHRNTRPPTSADKSTSIRCRPHSSARTQFGGALRGVSRLGVGSLLAWDRYLGVANAGGAPDVGARRFMTGNEAARASRAGSDAASVRRRASVAIVSRFRAWPRDYSGPLPCPRACARREAARQRS